MRCSNPMCNAELYAGDMFCGACGRPVPTPGRGEGNENDSGLFPLYGVTLGETTVNQLAQWGKRTSMINDRTGRPYECYAINGTDFWYDAGGVASHMYIARGIHPIPEPWRAQGFTWDISYNQWLGLLQRLGYAVNIETPPQITRYDGHASFSALIVAVKQARIPIRVKLDFNYSRGTTTDAQGTLYSISVNALNNS